MNKEVETCNIIEETVEAQRLVCDQVHALGGVLKVPLTKELLASVASARTRYRIYLDEEREEVRGCHAWTKEKSKSNTLMAKMITKSNTLIRRFKEKCNELKNVGAELELKSTELRYML